MDLKRGAASYRRWFRGQSVPSRHEMRSGLNRYRVANSYRRIFEDAAGKIVWRERENVLRAAKKLLAERSVKDWDAWLEDFYRDFPDYIGRQIAPAVRALAEAILPIAADEIHGSPDMTPELEGFLTDYVRAVNARYVQSSKGQLHQIVAEAEEGQDLVTLVDGRLAEWEQKRPGKVGLNETVQLSNAVAKVVFMGGGITLLRWQALGGESCPLCQEMDGRVVGIEKPFLDKEDTLKAEGGSEIKAYHPTTHPPLHPGCVCQIVPEG